MMPPITSDAPATAARPWRIEPHRGEIEASLEALLHWLRAHLDAVEAHVLHHGAILFRGFAVETAADFERVVRATGEDLLPYVAGNSPREHVAGQVYTSTSYPAQYPISLHNELSYAARWPRRLFFFCEAPAAEGGE